MLVHGGKLGPDDLIWKDPMPGMAPGTLASGLGAAPTARHVKSASEAASQLSGFAVMSLVLGILWLGGLGSLMAIVLGMAALSQIRHSGGPIERQTHRGRRNGPRRGRADVDRDCVPWYYTLNLLRLR